MYLQVIGQLRSQAGSFAVVKTSQLEAKADTEKERADKLENELEDVQCEKNVKDTISDEQWLCSLEGCGSLYEVISYLSSKWSV